MWRRILQYFTRSKQPPEPESSDAGEGEKELDLKSISAELRKLILQNKLEKANNERRIKGVERKISKEKELIKLAINEHHKRCSLRRLHSLNKRVERLDKCNHIYIDNINMQTQLYDYVENMIAAGHKIATDEILVNIKLDYDELLQSHHEMYGSIKAIKDIPLSDDKKLREILEAE